MQLEAARLAGAQGRVDGRDQLGMAHGEGEVLARLHIGIVPERGLIAIDDGGAPVDDEAGIAQASAKAVMVSARIGGTTRSSGAWTSTVRVSTIVAGGRRRGKRP